MWWIILALIGGLIIIYVALRRYINALVTKEAQFRLIVDKLQRETEAIITEFNRITDRNVTIAEENAIKLNKLIQQSKLYLTRLSKKQPPPTESVRLYSPQHVADQSAKQRRLAGRADDDVRNQILRLLRSGVAVEDIAARVGVAVSEVETIAAMLQT